MEELLVRLMLIAALSQFGMSVSDLANCRSRKCLAQLERNSRKVLKIDWKPISVFPEEAKRFR